MTRQELLAQLEAKIREVLRAHGVNASVVALQENLLSLPMTLGLSQSEVVAIDETTPSVKLSLSDQRSLSTRIGRRSLAADVAEAEALFDEALGPRTQESFDVNSTPLEADAVREEAEAAGGHAGMPQELIDVLRDTINEFIKEHELEFLALLAESKDERTLN